MMHRVFDTSINVIEPVDPVIIGKISGAYAVLGWIKIVSFTDQSNNIFNYNPWFIYFKSEWKLIHLDKWKLLGKHYIIKIRDISDRESAKLFMNCFIIADMKRFPHLQNGEYYCRDLIGCIVITDRGERLGHVINIIETKAHDILAIKIYKKNNFCVKTECLIPFVPNKVIKSVNISDCVIIVDWSIDF